MPALKIDNWLGRGCSHQVARYKYSYLIRWYFGLDLLARTSTFSVFMALVSVLKQPHSQALDLSQQASQFLREKSPSGSLKSAIPLIYSPESADIWIEHERIFLSCLRTGDDKGAFLCLEKLIDRFGATNEKVMGLRGLYQEAVAENDAGLKKILQDYNEILAGDPANSASYFYDCLTFPAS